MKRIIAVVGVVLGLGAIGLTAAHADNSGFSTWCTDGVGPSTDVPNGVVGLSYEPTPDGLYLCYSTTPNGSSSPEAAGGVLHVWKPPSNDFVGMNCFGDRNTSQVVVVECYNYVALTDPSSAPGTTASTSVKIGTVGPVPVGQTGAEVNPATTTNAPLGGAAGTGGSAGVGGGTCTWVNGARTCPVPGATVAGVTVNEADLVPSVTPSTPAPPCTGINNTCIPLGATVRIFTDTSNPTAELTTLSGRQPVDVAPTGLCVQVNATC